MEEPPIPRMTPLPRSQRIWRALTNTYNDFDQNNYLTWAAALAFYFFLSLFPLLIFLASLYAYIPVPNLLDLTLRIMAKLVPPEGMAIVRAVLRDVLQAGPKLLSVGIFGAIFAASGGFSSLISALNVAYVIREKRPYWKKRLLAFGLTLLAGVMVPLALAATILGPEIAHWFASQLGIGSTLATWWPYLRWAMIIACTVLSVEAIYFLGPELHQRFKAQVPGAAIAVLVWVLSSWGLGWYVAHIANYNRTFGTLGAVVGLMMWFYITALALILGAEINAELLHLRRRELVAAAPKAFADSAIAPHRESA
jgi:membrane protein